MSKKKSLNPLTWRPRLDTREALIRFARESGIPRNKIVQIAVEQYLNKQAKTPAA